MMATMQDHNTRRYWAERRKRERSQPLRKAAPKRPYVKPALLATSIEEYNQLRREHPDMQVNLRLPDQQGKLFDDREFKDE